MNQLIAGTEVQRELIINGKTVSKMKAVPKVKQQMSARAAEEDPLAALGYGIVAYTNILQTMIWVFIGFSVLLLPTMINYSAGDAYEGDPMAGFASGMISNMGYSSVECANSPIDIGQFTFSCPYGTVGRILDYGVNNPSDGSPVDACRNNSVNKACTPDSKSI